MLSAVVKDENKETLYGKFPKKLLSGKLPIRKLSAMQVCPILLILKRQIISPFYLGQCDLTTSIVLAHAILTNKVPCLISFAQLILGTKVYFNY
jgi:hypothetical protein